MSISDMYCLKKLDGSRYLFVVIRPGADECKKHNIGTRNEDFQDCVMCSSYFPSFT